MTCPDENLWMRYLGGALETGAINGLEQHLDGCGECRALYANLAKATDPTIAPESGTDPTVAQNNGIDSMRRARRFFSQLLEPSELVRGEVVDRYLIVGTLGRGGMGVVYKAFDPELDRTIALKLVAVSGEGSDAEHARARLLREAKTLAQLSHPNVVTVHDVGAYGTDVFVAMEFVSGSTLRAWLDAKQRAPSEILAVFRAAGAGLAAAHRVGIVHRDFKPENVMVADDGRVRVLDFGLARADARPRARPSLAAIPASQLNSELTHDGAIMGTPAYMAPEQDLGHPVDSRSDQFSFCAALYEALFGCRAFAGETYAAIAANRLGGKVVPAPSARGVSQRVRRALSKGLRVAPIERHDSMDALLLELGGPRRRTKVALAALALTSVAAGGWATWVATHGAPTPDELCARPAAEIDRVWNPKRRGDLIAKLDAMNLANGHATALRVADAADSYAAQWRAQRMKVCKVLVTGNGKREHEALTSASLECLNNRLTALDGTVSVFIHASTEAIVNRADAIVAGLDPIAACDKSDGKEVVTDQTRERWSPVMQDYVAGNTALSQGHYDEAERLARNVMMWARDKHEASPLAGALLLLGQAQSRKADARGARATLLEAVRAATEAREEEMATEAWLELVELACVDRGMTDELAGWVLGAELAATRLDNDDPLHVQLAFKTGNAHLLLGEIDAGLNKLERALAALQKAPDEHRYDIALVETSLGVAHMYRGEWDAARDALQRSLATLRSLPKLEANVAASEAWLGQVAMMQGDYTGAEPHFKLAVDTLESLGDAGGSLVGIARFQLGYVYAHTGRCNAARALFATSVAGLNELGNGYCELEAGNSDKAIALLERAAQVRRPPTLLQPAQTEFALARALAKRDKRRASELAQRARDEFARFEGAHADREAVEAWLAGQR